MKQPDTYNPFLYAVNPMNYVRYFTTGRGPLSSPGGLEVGELDRYSIFEHVAFIPFVMEYSIRITHCNL